MSRLVFNAVRSGLGAGLLTPREAARSGQRTQRRPHTFFALLSVAAIICSATPTASAQGITEIIAMTGNAAPDGNGTLDSFIVPVLNDAGQVAFLAALAGTASGAGDNSGIFRGAGGPLTQIAREKPSLFLTDPGLTDLGWPALNDAGQAAFTATRLVVTDARDGIFLGSGGILTALVLEGNAAPDGNGTFASFNIVRPSLNDVGQTAFHATLTGTSGGASDDSGIFRGSGAAVTQIAREGQAAPDGNGTFSNLGPLAALNLAGRVAFAANITGTSGGPSDNQGFFSGAGGLPTQIARAGQAAPDGNGTFSTDSFWIDAALNDAGQVAFRAPLTGTSGGASDNVGVFRRTAGALSQIARAGQAVPDGNGVFSDIFTPAMNDAGQAAFEANLSGTSGGANDDRGIFRGDGTTLTQIAREGQAIPGGDTISVLGSPLALNDSGEVAFWADISGPSIGIFLSNGIDVLQVARTGEALGGRPIINLFIEDGTGSNGDERSCLNNLGQVAYRASLSDGAMVIARFTIPDIHWTNPASGFWSTDSNWTQNTEPTSFHHTFIDPASGVTVRGDSQNTFVKSLAIGSTANGEAVL